MRSLMRMRRPVARISGLGQSNVESLSDSELLNRLFYEAKGVSVLYKSPYFCALKSCRHLCLDLES